jgi:hypothetical protein
MNLQQANKNLMYNCINFNDKVTLNANKNMIWSSSFYGNSRWFPLTYDTMVVLAKRIKDFQNKNRWTWTIPICIYKHVFRCFPRPKFLTIVIPREYVLIWHNLWPLSHYRNVLFCWNSVNYYFTRWRLKERVQPYRQNLYYGATIDDLKCPIVVFVNF